MRKYFLGRFFGLSLTALFAVSAYGEDNERVTVGAASPVTPAATVEASEGLLNQFSVICLKNNTNSTLNYSWSVDGNTNNMVLQPGYQQPFTWNDTGSHFVNIRYDADLSSSDAWKNYRLDASPAAFPDCQYGSQFHFANVGSRWIDIYTGLRAE